MNDCQGLYYDSISKINGWKSGHPRTRAELRISSKEEAKKLQVELFEIELLDLKGEILEKATKSYRRLLKATDKPLYLARTEE